MSRSLLQISVGPVQDFIAAARRTRDLWFGSLLLSEISKATAKEVEKNGGELIFPSPLESHDLDPDSDFNVANVILAEFNSEEEARNVSVRAKESAENRWNDFVKEAHDLLLNYVDEESWLKQKSGVIEFYAAWYPFDEEVNYKQARREVSRLLAARKGLRDFEVWEGKFGIPKSSLDGRRENVLKECDNAKKIGGVRIKKGEALDLVGCVKRAGGENKSFPSVTRIAVDPWIRGFARKENTRELLKDLRKQCEKLCKNKVLSKTDEKLRSYEDFPYEGQALLPQRYSDFEEGLSEPALSETVDAEVKMGEIMRKLSPLPLEPYLAVLVADGDRMGGAISALDTPSKHREFSKTLAKFAENAREIVRDYYGSCVYTGGDDVLAFLPLDMAVVCARKLHDAFGELWKENANCWGLKNTPTLSVGIAVGHAMEDLEDLLQFGRDAEKMAKKQSDGETDERNGLALTIRARGNSEMSIREQWKGSHDTPETAPLSELSLDERFLFWADRFANDEIPSKFPYELRSSAKFYEAWEEGTTLDKAMKFDIKRIFGRKDLKLDKVPHCRERIGQYIESALGGSYRSIERLAGELLIAQWIGEARERAGGESDDIV
jgi:CRISPR-associated protein Cmr2